MELVQNFPIAASLVFSLGLNLFFFIFASALKTDKVTDLSYSLTFFLMAPFLLVAGGMPLEIPRLILTILIMAWGLRLGSYLFYRILRIGKDNRFDEMRGDFFRFLRFWIIQALTVWIVMLPFIHVLTGRFELRFSPTFAAGLTVALAGLLIESISDAQKFTFKLKPENTGRWVDSGMWRWSRHPNYFGEILFWWGLFLAVLTALPGRYLFTAVGPLFITLMLLFVSGIPLLEKSADRRFGGNPDYRRYKESTALLIPRPPAQVERS